MQNIRLPKVSIIIPCYNSEKTLRKSLESILGQSYANIECIIIDGVSKDNTINIIKEYELPFIAKNFGYKWISESDTGIYDAMNKGIKIASGKFIGILGSDDWYEPDAMEKIINEYIKHPDADLIYGAVKFYRDDIPVYVEQIYEVELKKRTMHHQGIIYKKFLHDKYGYYSTNFRISSDYEFLLKCYLNNCQFNKIDALVANFRHGGANNQFHYIGIREEAWIKYKNKIITTSQLFKRLLKAFIVKLIKNN